MPDLYAGALIGTIVGFIGGLAFVHVLVTRSKAQRRRQWPTLTSIYDDIQGG